MNELLDLFYLQNYFTLNFCKILDLRSRPHPHYTSGIWKRSSIGTARLTVHTNPSRKRSFLKTLIEPEELQRRATSLSLTTKKGSFLKTITSRYWCNFPAEFSKFFTIPIVKLDLYIGFYQAMITYLGDRYTPGNGYWRIVRGLCVPRWKSSSNSEGQWIVIRIFCYNSYGCRRVNGHINFGWPN